MIAINGKSYKELRCAKCQRFVIYQNVSAGILALQCPKCDHMNEWVWKFSKDNGVLEEIKKEYQIEIPEQKGGEI